MVPFFVPAYIMNNLSTSLYRCRVMREVSSSLKTKQAFADSIDLFPLRKISAAL